MPESIYIYDIDGKNPQTPVQFEVSKSGHTTWPELYSVSNDRAILLFTPGGAVASGAGPLQMIDLKIVVP